MDDLAQADGVGVQRLRRPGLDPGPLWVLFRHIVQGGWTYILTNKPVGVLYIGVTADIERRIWEHRNGLGSRFCRRYGLDRLVLTEEYPTIEQAIAREKQLKNWRREWKIALVEAANPDWSDLTPRA